MIGYLLDRPLICATALVFAAFAIASAELIWGRP